MAASGFKFTGKGSWFGGPNDGMDSGRMASGHTTAWPSVAVRLPGKSWRDSRKYLGKYVRVTAPNGRSAVLPIGDLGPNESTGRNVDVTYSALKKLGYNERNFPTDHGFKVEYLGDKPSAPAMRQKAIGAVGQPGSQSKQQFDSAAYEDARKKSVLAAYLAKHQPQSSLVRMGVLDSTPPNPADYVTEVAQQRAATRTAREPGSRPAPSGRTARAQGLSPLKELFYDPQGGWKGTQSIGAIGGHSDHVHVAAGPKTTVRLGKRAQQMGLRVSENSHFNGGQRVTGGHVANSNHYRDEAIDVSGDPKKMAAFARYVRRLYGLR